MQPRPPRGRPRGKVLAQAAGNPMALIELAKLIADAPAASRRWAAEPVPLSDRLRAVLTSRFAALPEQAQAALLLAAVADSPDLSAAASRGSGSDDRALAPAEELGLVKIDRRAWHLAAAALQPDERVASLLEATATQAQRRGGAAAAALAMERTAELSPDPGDQARRPVAAASAAVPAGQADWVQDLAPRALAITAESALRLTARHDAGWALPCAPASRQSVSRIQASWRRPAPAGLRRNDFPVAPNAACRGAKVPASGIMVECPMKNCWNVSASSAFADGRRRRSPAPSRCAPRL